MAHHDAGSDLGYVRDLVEKSDRRPTPSAVFLLWAAIILVGFALVDLARSWVGYFWMLAAPLGTLASALLAHRAGKSRGQLRRETSVRHALHWCGMLVVIALAVTLVVRGHVPRAELGRVILLIVALGWWTAGVHFDRTFLLFGGIMMLGLVGTLVFPLYAWTTLGVLLSAGLTIAAFRRGGRRVSPAV